MIFQVLSVSPFLFLYLATVFFSISKKKIAQNNANGYIFLFLPIMRFFFEHFFYVSKSEKSLRIQNIDLARKQILQTVFYILKLPIRYIALRMDTVLRYYEFNNNIMGELRSSGLSPTQFLIEKSLKVLFSNMAKNR